MSIRSTLFSIQIDAIVHLKFFDNPPDTIASGTSTSVVAKKHPSILGTNFVPGDGVEGAG